MPLQKFDIFWSIGFKEEDFLNLSLYIPMKYFIPQLWPHPTPGDHDLDLNKYETTLFGDASKKKLSFSW